jgi:hypothetical protein
MPAGRSASYNPISDRKKGKVIDHLSVEFSGQEPDQDRDAAAEQGDGWAIHR